MYGAPSGDGDDLVGRDHQVDERLPGNDDHAADDRARYGHRTWMETRWTRRRTPSAGCRPRATRATGSPTSDHELECDDPTGTFDPADVEIDHILRFEGESDPGDMTIVFALRAPSGEKGVYSAAYGAHMPTEDADVIAKLRHRTGDGTTG